MNVMGVFVGHGWRVRAELGGKRDAGIDEDAVLGPRDPRHIEVPGEGGRCKAVCNSLLLSCQSNASMRLLSCSPLSTDRFHMPASRTEKLLGRLDSSFARMAFSRLTTPCEIDILSPAVRHSPSHLCHRSPPPLVFWLFSSLKLAACTCSSSITLAVGSEPRGPPWRREGRKPRQGGKGEGGQNAIAGRRALELLGRRCEGWERSNQSADGVVSVQVHSE